MFFNFHLSQNVRFRGFLCLHGNYCYGNKFMPSCSLSTQTFISLNNMSQRVQDYSKKLLQVCIFYTIAKDQHPNNGVKMRQTFRFWIFTTTCRIPE